MGDPAKIKRIMDECVLYYDKDDECWVAHSLRMDQVGTGDCVVDALVSLLRAVDFVLHDAAEDMTLAYEREAPKEIQDLKIGATKLPHEVYEIAHKIVHGEWPEDLAVTFGGKPDHPYITEINQEDSVAA